MAAMIDTIGKLLAHAEQAGTPEEAETYYAKAQSLASTHAIDLALAAQRHQRGQRTEVLTTRSVPVIPADGTAKPLYRKAYVDLFAHIALVNDLRVDVDRQSRTVFPFGYPSDIEVVERLYASLLVQMVAEADRQLKAGANRGPVRTDADGRTLPGEVLVDARRWRNGFYVGFTRAVHARLKAAREQAVASRAASMVPGGADGADEVGLVLARKAEKVRRFHAEHSEARGHARGTGSRLDGTAMRAGDRAGRTARLGSTAAVGGARGELA